jgi:hypothetical protein
VTGPTRHVTLSGVEEPPYPQIPGQPPPIDPRHAQRDHLRRLGYTDQQIEALLQPLPSLPPAQETERDWGVIILLIVAGVVVLCCVIAGIIGATQSGN